MSNLHDREEAVALMKAALRHPTPLFRKYNENQERDDRGRWGAAGEGGQGRLWANVTPGKLPDNLPAAQVDAWLAGNGVGIDQMGRTTAAGKLKDTGVGHITLDPGHVEHWSPTPGKGTVVGADVSNVYRLGDGRHVYWDPDTLVVHAVDPTDSRYSKNPDFVAGATPAPERYVAPPKFRTRKGMNLHDDEREEVVGLLKATIAGPLHAPNPNALVKAWEDQERDELGRWGAGGGDAGMTAEAIDRRAAERVTNRMADKIGFVQTGTNAKGEPEYKVADEAKFSAAVAEYHAAAERDTAGLGGRLLNTDIARELSPDYLKDRTLAAAVHEPASAFIKEVYSRMLAAPPAEGRQPLVLFTAGGTGAGKSSGMNLDEVKGQVHDADIIFDTNMNTYGSAEKKIEQGLRSGREVAVLMVHRDPVDALVNGALPRSMRQEKEFGSGRTVPLEEHAKTHEGALPTVRSLQMHYNGDARFSVRAVDNSLGRGNAKVVPIDSLKLAAGDLHVRLREALDHERQTGKISESVYRGFKGPSATPHVPMVAGKELGKLHGQAQRGVGEGPEAQGWRGKLKALTRRAA
jgi:hypothetical protein